MTKHHQPIFEGKPLDPTQNYLDESGAYILAGRIRNYWIARGFYPNVWVHKVTSSQSPTAGDAVVFAVKSDMLHGRPR